MPASRITRRRRSSLALGLLPVKPGKYGISPAVTFAPNVTPGTYNEGDDPDLDLALVQPVDPLFKAPAELPVQPVTSRRRAPPGKRRSEGYIPRPPNAFMLFRADFVKQKHVPGSIETNHGSLSRIIGNCWRALPLEEKKVWDALAKKAKAEHQRMYPDYRFRPVHNKHKKATLKAKRAARAPVPVEDEQRCDDVTHLLLEGKKGEELARAFRQLDYQRARTHTCSPEGFGMGMGVDMDDGFEGIPPAVTMAGAGPSHLHQPVPLYAHRRSSSVPPPSLLGGNPIMLPQLPFLSATSYMQGPAPFLGGSGSRAPSPVGTISRSQRTFLGQRRASSAQPVPSRSWMLGPALDFPPQMPEPWQLQRDWSPLPEPDMSLFQPGFGDGTGSPFAAQAAGEGAKGAPFAFGFAQMEGVSPLDQVPPPPLPHQQGYAMGAMGSQEYALSQEFGMGAQEYAHQAYQECAPDAMPVGVGYSAGAVGNAGTGGGLAVDVNYQWHSGPSSAFSGSPAHSDASLPLGAPVSVNAPAGAEEMLAPHHQRAAPMFREPFEEQKPVFGGEDYDGWGHGPPQQVHDAAAMQMQGMHSQTYALEGALGYEESVYAVAASAAAEGYVDVNAHSVQGLAY